MSARGVFLRKSIPNLQAGEPYQLQLVHTMQCAERQHVKDGPLKTVCRALALAAKQVHSVGTPCVAILTKPSENLALRTAIDVRGVGRVLREEHGMDVMYVSMRDLASSWVDSCGDLWLTKDTGNPSSARRIAVIYSRYDFSHPVGAYVSSMDAVPTELRDEWETIERIESSTAVMSSSMGSRLAHRCSDARQVAHALACSSSLATSGWVAVVPSPVVARCCRRRADAFAHV